MLDRRLGVLVVALFAGCGAPPATHAPEAKTPKKDPVVVAAPAPRDVEPPLTELVTGVVAPVTKEPAELEPQGQFVGPEFETLKFGFQRHGSLRVDPTDVVDVQGAIFAFVVWERDGRMTLWVRRPRAMAGTPLAGDFYTAAHWGPGTRFPMTVKAGASAAKAPAELERESLRALRGATEIRNSWRTAFDSFTQRRMGDLLSPTGRGAPPPTQRFVEPGSSELVQLMDTTTGRSAIQSAIMAENGLVLNLRKEPRKHPLKAAVPPALPRADYQAMLAGLSTSPPREPLAEVAPADFWFFRARTFGAFLDLLDLSETWGQPAADALSMHPVDRGTTARYTAELGLERTELARVLGPSVIESIGAVGSDPYVHEGTDLTLLFKVAAPPLFEASIAKALSKHASEHGGVTTSASTYEGVTIRVARSADGRVRQHRANVAGLELVSNSPGAIRRVIATALGKAPKLADETDFRFLTARDAGTPDDLLAFMSDRFVLRVIGPAQKIAQARRELALAELTTPGFAALLFGRLNGRSPKDQKELLKGGELLPDELKHADGSPIAFEPGKPASSRWGTTTYLEPLIDLPPVEMISETELRSYEQFASNYSVFWSEYVDPAIVRVGHSQEAPGRFDVALRALPVLRSENRDLMEMVGSARVDVPPLDTGLRWVLALGKEARFRRELEGQLSFAGQSLKLDWLGDHVRIGLADRAELTSVAHAFVKHDLEPRGSGKDEREDEFERLGELPLYAVVEVKNRIGAVVALGMLRKLASEFAHNTLEWRDGGKYRDVGVTDIAILPSGILRVGGHVYYALCPKGLVFSLHRAVLESVIDEELDGKAPRGASDPSRGSGQLVIELGAKKDGALLRTLGWFVLQDLIASPESRYEAEAILVGAPEARASDAAFMARARAVFGSVPLTPDGNVYRYTKEGLFDPVRGTAYAPIFPKTPVPGSPLDQVLSRFVRLRSGIAFDPEPGAGPRGAETRSFSAKFSLELR